MQTPVGEPMARKKKAARKKQAVKKPASRKTASKKKVSKKAAKKKAGKKTTAKKKTPKKKSPKKKATKKKAPKKKAPKKKVAKKKGSKKKPPRKKAASKKKPARKTRSMPAPKLELSPALVADAEGWIEANDGYALSIKNGKLACRNKKGKTLASVPKKVKDSELGEQLNAMAVWLKGRREECTQQVQTWMLRSLPVPLSVAVEVWCDDDWRQSMENVVVVPIDRSGNLRAVDSGILRDVDARKGLGVIDEDGETRWIKTTQFAIPHPVLMNNVAELRELLVDLNFKQPVEQLFREVHQAKKGEANKLAISRFGEGEFEQLNYALSACRTLGYQVSGGSAICSVWEGGQAVEARYWVGSDYPEGQTFTGDLSFVDAEQKSIKIDQVGPVALSEGIRMATAIYARRKVPKETEPTA